MGDGGRVEVAEGVAGHFELQSRGGNHEEAGAEVEGDGHLAEDLELGWGDVDVAYGLARGDGLAGEVYEGAGPGAGCDDDEVGGEDGAVLEGCACDGRLIGCVVEAGRDARDEGDAVEGHDFAREVGHCGAGVGPARERVDVAPCTWGLGGAEVVLDGCRGGQLLNDLVAVLARQGDDVVVAFADVFERGLLGLLLGVGVGLCC